MNIEKKIYQIKKIELDKNPLPYVWESVPEINIDCFPWGDNSYKPKTKAKVFYTDTHFHICFKSCENKIKITYFNMDEDVYKDSCVEFFVKPNPNNDDRYLNFEMNAIGTLLLGLGVDRHDRERIKLDNPFKVFGISTSVTKDTVDTYNNQPSKNNISSKNYDETLSNSRNNAVQSCCSKFWAVQYSIPFTFIEKYFGKLDIKSGYRLEGNFYKCGDETKYPHYGCWNPIKISSPDFHRPEFFGDLILE